MQSHLYGTFGRQSSNFEKKSGSFTPWFLNGPENETRLHIIRHLLWRGEGPCLNLNSKKTNLLTQLHVQDSYSYMITQSLTWNSLGCSTPESGCTERTLRSEPETLQWKCNATLLKFLMLRDVLEQEPTAVGLKNKLPSPSKVMSGLSTTHTKFNT